ncbi:MAG: tRNA nucleotidyltransferase [Clostridiales bacterium]|uniref:CCA tRNA nucleotidyltransferase n=1 Tax=Flavonifractor porci TaxID=3133422 RepID=UPI0030A777C6|nr:tRNA nucleotidyltransferase [Clostridiales bacterium]
MEKWPIPAGVQHCLDTLRQAGYAAHPVGGCVRDLLLGRTPGDYDVCTSAYPEQVMGLFEHTVPTGIQHGTVTVLTEDGPVEVTTFRREGGYADGRHPDGVIFDVGLTEDLARRDFTINAMALGPEGEIIDPFDGQKDLEAEIIRCVGEPDRRFSEDALRMLRAVRFAAQLGFAIEPATEDAIRRNAGRVSQVSGERIKAEMEKTLLSPHPERAEELIRWGLLAHLWPQRNCPGLVDLRNLPPQPIPRWRGFCTATGFPLERLPVERALKRGVYHPEIELVHCLTISGGELAALGLKGREIGTAQRKLAFHVLDHPEDNRRDRLLELLQKLD